MQFRPESAGGLPFSGRGRGRAYYSPGPPQHPSTFLAKFGGGAKGVAILALFKTRAAHGLSL